MMFPWYFHQPQLALACQTIPQTSLIQQQEAKTSVFDNLSIWFAVPKRKTSHGKKRLRTIYHKRIKVKNSIITDPRTGEITLMHRLPYNWEKYLPNTDHLEKLKKPY
jgi:ribosomal protein L32